LTWLTLQPNRQQDEMVYFIWDTFEVAVSESAIGRVLKRARWNKKIVNRPFRHRFLT
jgi:hypothetical protein